jgi:hypothetical protein
MRHWREWDLEDWNTRLLQHFFEISSQDGGFPIITLLVTKEELAKATGERGCDPQEVQKQFVSTVLQSLPPEMMLLDHACTFPFNPDFALPVPPYVAHLIFTCLAASESSDELGNEGSYRKRLNELAHGKCPDNKLELIKHLWERLQRWLVHPANTTTYRPLVLPDPGPHTRIGYTEGLAFPGRLDQRDLTEVLKNADMIGTIPPPGKVIMVVSRNIATFRNKFREAFEDFRYIYHNATGSNVQELLVNHRFWSAVVESCLRGRTSENVDEQTDKFELIASFQDESVGLYLLSQSATQKAPDGFDLEVLAEPTGPWVAALVGGANRSSNEAIAALFTGRLKMLRLRHIISQGFLPFASTDAGQYSLARSSTSIAMASHALVRDELVGPVKSSFGGNIVDCAAPVPGWRVIEGLRISTLGDDDATALRDVWLLQRQLAPRKIFLSRGIRSDDGWLGFADALPQVTAEDATSVFANYNGTRLALNRSACGLWIFPPNDYQGQVHILAFKDETLIAQMLVKFIPSPASEDYKTPRNQHAFYTEGQRGAVPLRLAAYLSETDVHADMGTLTGRILLLGRNQGEFVASERDAAWKVIRGGGGKNYISLPDSLHAGKIAEAKADVQGLRRKWRTFIQQSSPIGDRAELSARLTAARSQLRLADDLPLENYPVHSAPSVYAKTTFLPAKQTVLLAHALAGRGAAKRGIAFADWKALVCAFTGLPEKTRAYEKCAVEALTRCWQEAGIIDVVTSASWSGRIIFPIKPTLAIIKNGPVFQATLSGLCLDSTVRRATEKAKDLQIVAEDKRSACCFVPALSLFSSLEFDKITALSLSLGVPIRWVLVADDVPGAAHVEATNPPPCNYDTSFRFRNWSLNGREHPTVAMTFYKRDDRPAFWGVENPDTPRWSYSKNAARIHACRVAGQAPFKLRGDHEIVVEHAYLPLPFARYSAFAGPILPGPDSLLEGGEGHVYAFGTRQFRDQVFASATH